VLPPSFGQWQVLGNLRQRRELQIVELDGPGGDLARRGVVQRELEVRRIEARPAGARERQALGKELARSGLAAPANPSLAPSDRPLTSPRMSIGAATSAGGTPVRPKRWRPKRFSRRNSTRLSVSGGASRWSSIQTTAAS